MFEPLPKVPKKSLEYISVDMETPDIQWHNGWWIITVFRFLSPLETEVKEGNRRRLGKPPARTGEQPLQEAD